MTSKLTYKEASSIAIKEGVKTSREYMALCFTIKELPKRPDREFDEFRSLGGWRGFLYLTDNSNPTRHPKYESMIELKRAIETSGIKDFRAYINGDYRKDPKMPGNPFLAYGEEFTRLGGAEFLFPDTTRSRNLYRTYDEVKSAVKRLGIKTSRQYFSDHKLDPRLPGSPHRTIPNFKESGNFKGLFV